jgi:hypothetical protein
VEGLKGALEDVTKRIEKFKEDEQESKSTLEKLRDKVRGTPWCFIDSGRIHYQVGGLEDRDYILIVGNEKNTESYFLFVSDVVLKRLNQNNGVCWSNNPIVK